MHQLMQPNLLAFTLLLALASTAAGFLGSLTGLGGGVVLLDRKSVV